MFLWAVSVSLAIAVALGETYAFFIDKLVVSPWIAILAVHCLLAAFLLKWSQPLRESCRLRGGPLMPWLAAPLVLAGAFFLVVSVNVTSVANDPLLVAALERGRWL